VSPELTHDEIEDLLGAYALNAVEGSERAQVERHLERCPRCRAEVADHREVAALLANGGADAPEGVWQRITDALEESPPPMRLDLAAPGPAPVTAPVTDLAAGRRAREERRAAGSLAARVAVMVGAAAAVVIGFLGVQVVRQERLLDDMRATLNEDASLRAANLALADPDGARARLESPDGSLAATAVVLPNGTGYLLAHDLPALDENRTYQLWGAADDVVISLGVLGSNPDDVVPFQASGPVELLVITDEEAPGVPQSEQPPLLAGAV
jgi:hypothetical protein